MAGIKIQGCISKCLKRFPSFFYKSSVIQGVGIHNCHMGEYSSVFFFTICKSKHTPHIKFQFMEIGIQAVTADFFLIKIVIGASCNLFNLAVFRSSAHDSKDLSGQHHAHMIFEQTFNGAAMIIIIAVKPSFFTRTVNPFLGSQTLHEPIRFLNQIYSKSRE